MLLNRGIDTHCPHAGTPSTATAFYYNIYAEDSNTPVNTAPLLAAVATATGASAPATPSGSIDYSSLTTADLLSFNTGNLAALTGLTLARGVYQVWASAGVEVSLTSPTPI